MWKRRRASPTGSTPHSYAASFAGLWRRGTMSVESAIVPPANSVATPTNMSTGRYSIMPLPREASDVLGVQLPDRLRQRGHDLEQVADQPVVRHLEDRGLGILVDRDDAARGGHPREVLDRPRDPDRDVELGRDRLAGLAHLVRM